MRRWVLGLWCAVGFAGSAWAQEAPPDLPALLARVLRAAEGINDLVVTQSVTLTDPEGSGERVSGERRLYLRPPGRRRVEMEAAGQRVVIIVNGEQVAMMVDGRAVQPPPAGARSRREVFGPQKLTPSEMLRHWQELGVKTMVVHRTTRDGRPLVVVGAAPADARTPSIWLDEEWGVDRVITQEVMPAGPRTVDLRLSDHRRIHGDFFYPHLQETYVNFRPFSTVIVTSVKVNVGLGDSLFLLPAPSSPSDGR
jgi:outer membrane lipoprotein-sorting protein